MAWLCMMSLIPTYNVVFPNINICVESLQCVVVSLSMHQVQVVLTLVDHRG